MDFDLPKCQMCNEGTLIPLSDFGPDGQEIMYKAWVCSNPKCGFNLRVDHGLLRRGRIRKGDPEIV